MSAPKALFDAVRKLLGRPLRQSDVDAVNAALEASTTPDAPSEPERSTTPQTIGPDGLTLIKQFEGCAAMLPDGRIQAYPDPGTNNLPITIGWGSTRGLDGQPIPRGTIISQADADWLLARDMDKYASEVKAALGPALARTSQRQFDALVSFHYNTGAIARATLTAKHRAGDFAGAAAEFARWNRAGGRVLAGLVRRRAAERQLYEAGS